MVITIYAIMEQLWSQCHDANEQQTDLLHLLFLLFPPRHTSVGEEQQ